jgi:hypothetical protein
MPKNSGEEMKTIRRAPIPRPEPRPIMHQELPSGPKLRPMSPAAPKIAADLKPEEKHPSGSIDPRQQHY